MEDGDKGADMGTGEADRSAAGVTGLDAAAVGVTGRSVADAACSGVGLIRLAGLGFGMSVGSALLAARLRPSESRLFLRRSLLSFFGDDDDGLTPKATASLLIEPLRGLLPSPDCRE